MNNNIYKIVRTYNLGNGKKISIRNDGIFYYTVNYHFQQLPSTLTVYDGELYWNNNNSWQKWPEDPFPSTMLWHGALIDFDNRNEHLWPSMGDTLANIYCAWRSGNPKIPNNAAKNQFKKAFILMGKNGINLSSFINYNDAPAFKSFLDFAKTILNHTNNVNDCDKLNQIFQSCCLPNEKVALQDFCKKKLQQLKNNNKGFYQNNFNQFNNINQIQQNNQLNHFDNQNYNKQIYTTTIPNEFFGELQIHWRHNGANKALITGLTINGTKSNTNLNDLQGEGVYLTANDGQLIMVKFKNNNTLEIYNWNDQFPLARINLLQQVNQNQNVNNNQNFNANNNFNKMNVVPEAFIQNINVNQQNLPQQFGNFNNVNINQQNLQQNFSQGENNVLNNIQQFYNQNLGYKYYTVSNYYLQSDPTKWCEIQNFCNNQKDTNKLDDFYNKEYAKYLIKQCKAQEWKELVSKCVPYDNRIGTFSRFLKDAGYECFASFLEKPLVNLNSQQKLKIINEMFGQNTLLPSPQYKKYFGDIVFLNFLAWYSQQEYLSENPNAATLACLFGNYNQSVFDQKRCNGLLGSKITWNNGNQSYQTKAVYDKIFAYYIGYILFSNTQQTQGFSRLFVLKTIFPWLQKYIYDNFGQPTFDWFPEAVPPLIGGVEICQPKPVDEDVKKCLDKLSKNGVKNLGSEYQVGKRNRKTTIQKGNKLIFEGTLSKDGKGLKEGTIVIKYDNKDQPDECYEGQFKGVQMHGNGTYVFAKRFPGQKKHEAYKGQFKDGEMHGQGTYYTADGFSAEITYDNGSPINVKNAKDRSNTDVIVFDFFGFGSEAFEDKGLGGRYNSSFFITDDRSYQYKREKIFGLKDGEGLQKLSDYYPSASQQKAMDFIKTHLLIQGADHYEKLFNEEELRKIQGFDFDKAMQEFGAGQPQFEQLSQLTSQEAKEKWLCFVIDKIGPDAFNELYLEDNMNYHFSNIQQNKDKKLKVVLNIHGTPQLGMSFGPKMEGNKEKFALINKVFQKAASLGRDMYVSNNSCFGSQFLDDKQDIFKQMGVDIFENKADFKPIITYSGINESINAIKQKYGSTDKFLEKCKLKAEADSWRLTKNYSLFKNCKDLLQQYQPNSLKDFFVNTFGNVFSTEDNVKTNLLRNGIFKDCKLREVKVTLLSEVLGTDENIDFLQKIEKITKSDRKVQQFDTLIRDFFDFVKNKLFKGDNLDQLTDEGEKIAAVIEARKKILDDIIKKDYIKKTDKVLEKIDAACEKLEGFLNDNDRKQINLLKEEIREKFDKNNELKPCELRVMLSKVDLFNSYGTTKDLFEKLENEFVKEKMQGKLKANNMTLEQLDEFGNKEVNKMLGHLSTSIWLTRSFLLGGVLSKEMGVDKILESFREKCYRLLYKFGDKEINDAAMTELNLELNQEVGKIKQEIATKIKKYVTHIKMDNWNGVKKELQELKNKILEDNYYTQQLSQKQIEVLKQQTFDFDKNNLVNFLNLLPKKLEDSIDEAKKNIVDYCNNMKENNKQSIKDLLKQLKNDKMQNKHIIYSANMTGMTPSYMIEMTDCQAKKSNRNLGKMYYEVKNGQIEPLVKNKQAYEEALREFENKLANTEKNGVTDDTPGLEGIKFYEYDDVERLQSEKLMKFVKEGKKEKNNIMGWIEEEKNHVAEKFPENTKIKEQHDNNCKNQQVISNSQPEYAINGATKVPKNNTKNRNIGTYNPYGPHDAKNNNPTYNQYTQYSQLDNNPLG